jgi:hypothetical protein
MFEVSLSQTQGMRNDRGRKFIPNTYLYNIRNYNFDNIIGLSRILAPQIDYDNGGTAGIDGIFQFRYIDSTGTLQVQNIIVTNGNVIKDAVNSVLTPTTIYSGLTPGHKCTFAILNDKLFISNGEDNVLVYNGTVVYEMGAPIATNNNAAGNLNGDYYYAISYFIDGVELITGCVSNTVTATNHRIDLTLPIGPTGTTERDVYRVEGNGTQLKFLVKINNNTATTYTDNTADGSLGADIGAINSPAPKPKFITVKHERLVGVGNARRPNYLYTSEIEIESLFATIGVADVSGQGNDNTSLTGMAEDYDQLIVFSEKRIYLADVSGEATTIKQTSSNVGCLDGHTIAKVPPNLEFKGGLMFVSNEYDIRVFNGQIAVNLATSFDNLATENFSSALNSDQLKNAMDNVPLEGEYFDYKYHLIIGNTIYVYDIRIQGWTTYLIKTQNYSPSYRKMAVLGETFFIGHADTMIVEKMYVSTTYRSEVFESTFEPGELFVSDIYKLYKNLQIYYGNSGDVTVSILITPDNNSNLATNVSFSFTSDGFDPDYYEPAYYETETNEDDYVIAHINKYSRWIRFRFTSNNVFNFRGYKLTGEQISNEEVLS